MGVKIQESPSIFEVSLYTKGHETKIGCRKSLYFLLKDHFLFFFNWSFPILLQLLWASQVV